MALCIWLQGTHPTSLSTGAEKNILAIMSLVECPSLGQVRNIQEGHTDCTLEKRAHGFLAPSANKNTARLYGILFGKRSQAFIRFIIVFKTFIPFPEKWGTIILTLLHRTLEKPLKIKPLFALTCPLHLHSTIQHLIA